MVFEYWHLAVVAALVALIVWGLRVARNKAFAALAAGLLVISAWLLWTLVLEEAHLDQDLTGQIETGAIIGIPALLGAGLAALAFRRAGSR